MNTIRLRAAFTTVDGVKKYYIQISTDGLVWYTISEAGDSSEQAIWLRLSVSDMVRKHMLDKMTTCGVVEFPV